MSLPPPLRPSARVLLPLLGLLLALVFAPGSRDEDSFALPSPLERAPRERHLAAHLESALSVDRILAHMRALEEIALAHGGDRATGTAGYDASVEYVAARLREAGYRPERASLEYDHFTRRGPAELVIEGTAGAGWREPADLRTLTHAGSGDVTGPVASAGTGCAATSLAAVPRGGIALVERGECSFAEKARLAHAAGAAALLVVPSAAHPRSGPVRGSLLAPAPLPVLGATRAVGEALRARLARGTLRLRARTDTASERRQSASVLAETAAGDPREVVLLGAHLDSVIGSPGIDDNASSVGLLLELARVLAERGDLAHRVRFAFWTGEEKRLLGSRSYVAGLGAEERTRIALYLNFDMIASPNFARIVYDGDGSAGGAPWPEGSAAVERAFREAFAARGLGFEERDLTGRSDHSAFIAAGIAAGGVASFARGEKTAAQATRYGGTAHAPLQPCYHRECDTLASANPEVLADIARVTATVVGRFAGVAVPVPYARRLSFEMISYNAASSGGRIATNLPGEPDERLGHRVRAYVLDDRCCQLVWTGQGRVDFQVVELRKSVNHEVLRSREVWEPIASGELAGLEDREIASDTNEVGGKSAEGSNVGLETGRIVQDQIKDKIVTAICQRTHRRSEALFKSPADLASSGSHERSSGIDVVYELDSFVGARLHADVRRGQHRDHRVGTEMQERPAPLLLKRAGECSLPATRGTVENEDHPAVLSHAQRVLGRAALDAPDRDQISIPDWTDVSLSQSHQSLGTPGCGHELDLEPIRDVHLDDGTEIPAAQSLLGQIAIEHHGVQLFELHLPHLG